MIVRYLRLRRARAMRRAALAEYGAARSAGDTRRMHHAWKRLSRATHAVLALEAR